MISGLRIAVLFAACLLSVQTFAIGFNNPQHHDAETPADQEGRCVDFAQGQQPDLSGHLLKQKNVDAAGPVQDRGGATGPFQVAGNAGPMRFITNVGTPDAGAHFRNPSVTTDTGLDEPYTYKGRTLTVREWFRVLEEDNQNYGVNVNQIMSLKSTHTLLHRDDTDIRYQYALETGAVWSPSEGDTFEMRLVGQNDKAEGFFLDGREFSRATGFSVTSEWEESLDLPVGDSHRVLRITATSRNKSFYVLKIQSVDINQNGVRVGYKLVANLDYYHFSPPRYLPQSRPKPSAMGTFEGKYVIHVASGVTEFRN
jgi:hypothetical protein